MQTDVKPIYDVTDGPSGIKYLMFDNFMRNYMMSGRSSDFRYMNFDSSKESVMEIISMIEQFSKDNGLQYFTFARSVSASNDDMFVNCGYGDEENTSVYQVECSGAVEVYNKLFEFLQHKEKTISRKEASINWFYRTMNGIESKSIKFDKNPNKIYNEFYPFIEEGVSKYMRAYMKSKSSVLVMIGCPGTGKTSLIRDFIFKNNLKTNMTFDESVIASDNFFVDFITDKRADLLVMEDADALIGGRDEENNRQMAKFLNITDGLVSHQDKKMIFTTNLSSVDRIDSALLRPGRCYGVLNFKKLSVNEVNNVRKRIGKPPLELRNKEYTLAEAFNEIHSNIEQTEKYRIGLI